MTRPPRQSSKKCVMPRTRVAANADGKMTEAQRNEYLKRYEAKLICPAEAALWKRGASNANYHYLGCAKTFALMGKAFAEATLQMSKAAGMP